MAAWLERDEWRAFSDFLALGGAALCVIIGLILAVAGADRAIAFHGCILLGVALLAFLYILTQVMEKKETHDATSYADGVIRAGVVEQTAREAGIDTWQAEMKPAGKIDWLERCAKDGHKVLMAGDGLNDAPALAAAHASISPASAADISQRAADFVFQGAKLWPVVEAIATGRRAHRMAFQNFGVAAVYNIICVPLAMAGFVTPLIAAIVMSTSSILVTLNAARLAGGGRT